MELPTDFLSLGRGSVTQALKNFDIGQVLYLQH